MRKFKGTKTESKHPGWSNPGLMMLLDDARSNFDADFTANQKVRLLDHLQKMQFRDENLLERFADSIRSGKITQSNHLTHLMYIFAKYKWKSPISEDYIQIALHRVIQEPGLNSYLATRNLWNLYAFDYYDEVALNRFSLVLRETKPEKLSELDIADALRSFAHF